MRVWSVCERMRLVLLSKRGGPRSGSAFCDSNQPMMTLGQVWQKNWGLE
jgi:hypothetical protein